ncbi:glucosidase II [Malassezia pachydermatis]|uniref:Glucosidase II subunit alpha n=1 Tax=Malassezia pachydermatis TaxID=77020 RepID=A0A0M8MKN7_9BASI|nr:glycoside hydrolase family 31 protein [Malassezia pachydermatis]KOS14396.1 glycoside hydrolase family 31 protein [Malassezia pachydermatis]
MQVRALCLAWAWIASVVTLVAAVRSGEFKTCQDSGFCRRFRRRAEYTESFTSFTSPYAAEATSQLTACGPSTYCLPIASKLHEAHFDLRVSLYDDGNARVYMDEAQPTYEHRQHYNEAHVWGVETMPQPAAHIKHDYNAKTNTDTLTWHHHHAVHIAHEPLRISFVRDGVVQMILNERSLLHMEHFRAKPTTLPDDTDEARNEVASQRASALAKKHSVSKSVIEQWSRFEVPDHGEWEETWAGTTDSKPKGPEGIALDISFPGYDTLYGLPEHASSLSLRSTRAPPHGEVDEPHRYNEPYRLMNTDVFEYEYDSPMALYGSVPVVHAISQSSAASVLWMNAAETWVDIHKTKRRPGPSVRGTMPAAADDAASLAGGSSSHSSHVYFMSESGVLDLFVFLGPSLHRNMERFMSLVGRTALPQYFALGYHQCRWNYWSDDDVKDVSAQFDEKDMPMDVMWLDIEWSRDHMYGIWDRQAFKDPDEMVHALDARGRKLVLIIDPHLKKTDDYFLYHEAKSQDLLVKAPNGHDNFEGVCWSGDASWIDFFQPRTWQWWIDFYHLAKRKLLGNARNVFVWNDMSEPAIFSGPEITSPKDVVHFPHWENRDIHNINGAILHNLTSLGLRRRELGTKDAHGQAGVERRPFVLSRAWWIGSQRYGAIWTGDNMGTWEHFANSVAMILQNGMGGMSFCGADIGGFFGNPDEQLLLRWYQAGIFEPFFRAHAHIDSKRREPYLYEGAMGDALRGLLQLRYQLLPVWYTAFWHSSVNGQPVLTPQALAFPRDPAGFAIDDQYFLGASGLLVKPPVAKDTDHVSMYLADKEVYYHFQTHRTYHAPGKHVNVPAPLTSEVPLLLRGGSIVATRERPRRAAELQRLDPFTLHIGLRLDTHDAEGQLYVDDGQTYAFRDDHAFVARHFSWQKEGHGARLRSTPLTAAQAQMTSPAANTAAMDAALQQRGNVFEQAMSSVRIERIVVLGYPRAPTSVVGRSRDGEQVAIEFSYTPAQRASAQTTDSSREHASELVLRNPGMPIGDDWEIVFL